MVGSGMYQKDKYSHPHYLLIVQSEKNSVLILTYDIHLGVYMHSKYLWFYECLKLVVHGQEGNTCSCTRVKINCVHICINSSGLQKPLAAPGSEEVYRSHSIREQETLCLSGGATSYHIHV